MHKDKYKSEVYRATLKYLSRIGAFSIHDEPFAVPTIRYLLEVHRRPPIKHVLISERPYATPICGDVFSAISYDPSKSSPTPSTYGLALDVHNVTGIPMEDVEVWFRDSWKYLGCGVLVVNVMFKKRFMDADSIDEKVHFQDYITSILRSSVTQTNTKVSVVPMGVPAEDTMKGIMGSLGTLRHMVQKHKYVNPAIVSRLGLSDSMSQTFTFEKPGTSRFIAKLIQQTSSGNHLRIEDYVHRINMSGSEQEGVINDMLLKSKSLVDEIESSYKFLEKKSAPATLTDAYDAFARSMIAYRDTVVRDCVRHSLEQSVDSSQLGKNSLWGSKKTWKKANSTIGSMSQVSGSVGSEIPQSFAGEDDGDAGTVHETITEIEEPVTFADDDGASTKPPPESKRNSTESSKLRVIRKKRQVLTEADKTDLRSINYYVQEHVKEYDTRFIKSVKDTVTTGKMIGTRLPVVLTAARQDRDSKGATASKSLGYEDGEMDEDSQVLLELRRLAISSDS